MRRSNSVLGLLVATVLLLSPAAGLAQPGYYRTQSGFGRPSQHQIDQSRQAYGQSRAMLRATTPLGRPALNGQSALSRNNILRRLDPAGSLNRRAALASRSNAAALNAARLQSYRTGTPRGVNAALVSQRRGTTVYSVRSSNGRTQSFAFRAPSASRAPLQIRTDHGDVGIRVVGFDVDGTLVDTRQTIADGVRAGCEALGVPTDEAFILDQTRGKPYSEVAHNAIEHFRGYLAAREPGGQLTEARATQLQQTFFDRAREVTETSERAGNARAYPGAAQLVRDLRAQGVRVVAVTSRPTQSALALLRQSGMDRHFDVVVGRQQRIGTANPVVSVRGELRAGRLMDAKPSPASLLLALRLAGRDVHPSQVAYVGDMHTDLRTADAAGTTPIAITHGMDLEETLRAERPAATVPNIDRLRTTLGLDSRPPAGRDPAPPTPPPGPAPTRAP